MRAARSSRSRIAISSSATAGLLAARDPPKRATRVHDGRSPSRSRIWCSCGRTKTRTSSTTSAIARVAVQFVRLRRDLAVTGDTGVFDAQEQPRAPVVVLGGRANREADLGVLSPERRLHPARLRRLLSWFAQPGWRNRQTRRPQKSLLERVCGFKSHSGHDARARGCNADAVARRAATLRRRRRDRCHPSSTLDDDEASSDGVPRRAEDADVEADRPIRLVRTGQGHPHASRARYATDVARAIPVRLVKHRAAAAGPIIKVKIKRAPTTGTVIVVAPRPR